MVMTGEGISTGGCGEVMRGGCLSGTCVTRSTVLTEVERRTKPNMMLPLH